MKKRKNLKPLLLGISSILFSLLLLGMSGIMVLIKEEQNDTTLVAVLLAVTSILPMMVAAACFVSSLRTIVLKAFGVLTAIGCAAILVNAAINYEDGVKIRMVLAILAGVIFGIFLAVKGKWPEEDDKPEVSVQ